MLLPLIVFLIGFLVIFHVAIICLRTRTIQQLEAEVKHWRGRWAVSNTALQDSEAKLLEYTLRNRNLEALVKDSHQERFGR